VIDTIINDIHVKNSQQSFLVIPAEIYAPNCIVKIVVVSYVAGSLSSFDVQGRDFYSNNIVSPLAVAITDYTLEFRN
jgi:hypothetical protein